MGVRTGPLRLFLAYQAVEYVQRVEKEVRIHLVLELYIPILCHIGLFTFLLHLASCGKSIIDHEDNAVYGDLGEERGREQRREMLL